MSSPQYKGDSTRLTVATDVAEMYFKETASLKKLIHKKRVSLTTDIWIAPTTCESCMIVTAYWIDANWELQKRIISFKPITNHSGEAIASHLIECLDAYGIEKVFTVTVSNAEGYEYEKTLTLFKDAMRLKGANGLVKDGDFIHIRCCSHILNMIVRDSMEHVSDSVAAVRNAVKYAKSSDTRFKSFVLRKVSEGNLALDNVNEWNSTYLMLSAAIKLKVAFEKMLVEDKLYGEWFLEIVEETGEKRVGPPSSATWDEVERLVKFLELFFDFTLAFSSSKSAASSICYGDIVSMGMSLISLSNDVDGEVKKQGTSMKDKFDKYWDGFININPVLIVASVFDPRKKMKFASLCFDDLYGKDSLESNHLRSSVTCLMRQLYEEYKQSQSDHGDSWNELDNYLNKEHEPWGLGLDYDVLSWWNRNSSRYPILSELARDVLAIQVSSIAPESAFCTGGRILDSYRSSLTPYFTEALICTQQWLQSNFKFEAEQHPSLEEMFEELDFQESLDPRNQTESGH